MDYAAELKEVEPRKFLPRTEARKQALELLAPIVEHELRPHFPSLTPRIIARVVRKNLRGRLAYASTPAANKQERLNQSFQAYFQKGINCPVPLEITTKYPPHQLGAYKKLAYSLSFVVDDVFHEMRTSGDIGCIRENVAESILIALLQEEDVLYYISNPIRAAEAAMSIVFDLMEHRYLVRH